MTIGARLIIVGERIDLSPSGRIFLDNKSVGGTGGPGGNGGNGGRGGNGIEAANGGRGGDGGPPGDGGTGGAGGRGGILDLFAATVVLDGEVWLRGGKGGDGGPVGTPGNGGAGGDAGPEDFESKRGGNGGNAGESTYTTGFTGGRGGPGGPGGTISIHASSWSINGIIRLDGGEGGQGGAGLAAGRAKGAAGGSPNGESGMDSLAIAAGQNGPKGPEGSFALALPWIAGPQWTAGGPVECMAPFTEMLDDATTLRGVKVCGGNCLSSFVSTDPSKPSELTFYLRWLSTIGTLEVRLGEQLVHTVSAPPNANDGFERVRVLVTDPAILGRGFQRLEVCLLPEGPAMAQIGNLVFRAEPESQPPPPEIEFASLEAESSLRLTWRSAVGFNYQVQRRRSLFEGNWTDLGDPLPGTGAALAATVEIEREQTQTFFRVVLSATP